jgi:hypothetical protein
LVLGSSNLEQDLPSEHSDRDAGLSRLQGVTVFPLFGEGVVIHKVQHPQMGFCLKTSRRDIRQDS